MKINTGDKSLDGSDNIGHDAIGSESSTKTFPANSGNHNIKEKSDEWEDDIAIRSRSPSPGSPSRDEHEHEISQPSSSSSQIKDEKKQLQHTGLTWNTSFPDQQPDNEDDNEEENEDSSNHSRRGIRALTRRFKFHLRGYDDDDESDWWFASTAIPLLAATIAPLANVLSIAALVTYFRIDLRDPKVPGGILSEFDGRLYKDPRWAYWLNVGSLICGFVGNIFLLFNFTGRIRYIIALPVTIILWFLATALLMGITIATHLYIPPERPYETYSQGFWYAVMAACLYFVCSALLMFNMLGYFLGHYPQRFELNDHQRTLILQTMLFFIWLAGGGAVFSAIESMGDEYNDWTFVDGLYFCDVTILTIGFGDLTLRNDVGRGLIFPYTVGGIVMLGLVISSISKFASEMSEDNVVQKHKERIRSRTLERSTTDPLEIERHEIIRKIKGVKISAPFNIRHLAHEIKHRPMRKKHKRQQFERKESGQSQRRSSVIPQVQKRIDIQDNVKHRKKRFRLLREERDRFDEMRRIQLSTERFKKWWSLTLSVSAFAILWCFGAVVFWQAEKEAQGMSYFQALYFCYVSLLTIGYGDFAPKSNAGRPFFVVWSLIAVPTMTLLINDMSGTVIDAFKQLTFSIADFTLLLKKNVYTDYVKKHPRLMNWRIRRLQKKAQEKRFAEGIQVRDMLEPEPPSRPRTPAEVEAAQQDEENELKQLAKDISKDSKHAPSEAKMARQLAIAIRHIATDLRSENERRYTFEEWAQITRLIRFTTEPAEEAVEDEQEDVIDWDWLGEKSPMMSSTTESEFVLDRLCESLIRYMKRIERRVERAEKGRKTERRHSIHVPDRKMSRLASPTRISNYHLS